MSLCVSTICYCTIYHRAYKSVPEFNVCGFTALHINPNLAEDPHPHYLMAMQRILCVCVCVCIYI